MKRKQAKRFPAEKVSRILSGTSCQLYALEDVAKQLGAGNLDPITTFNLVGPLCREIRAEYEKAASLTPKGHEALPFIRATCAAVDQVEALAEVADHLQEEGLHAAMGKALFSATQDIGRLMERACYTMNPNTYLSGWLDCSEVPGISDDGVWVAYREMETWLLRAFRQMTEAQRQSLVGAAVSVHPQAK